LTAVLTLAIVWFIIGVWGPMRDISHYQGEEVNITNYCITRAIFHYHYHYQYLYYYHYHYHYQYLYHYHYHFKLSSLLLLFTITVWEHLKNTLKPNEMTFLTRGEAHWLNYKRKCHCFG
jgi:hypothetical protein